MKSLVMKPLPTEDALMVVEQTVADEHYRQQHATLDWKHCGEPLCTEMRAALHDLQRAIEEGE